MTPLTFADTHNMIVFLSKSDASDRFDQIVDFQYAQVIHYALMVNLTIYVSCIKQFWDTASIKKDEEDEVPAAPTPPSPTHEPSPPPQEPITSSPQAQRKYDDNAAVKEVNAADPIVFNDGQDKREAKGKIPIDLSTGVRDLRDEFEEFSVNNTNRVNAASAPVTVVGPNPSNNTNSFNAASPFDNAVSPNFEIDDEENVDAEADFSNLETNISVSSITTNRVYKDHPITQIIGDLTFAPQTRSMVRMVKEQGGLNQMNDDDFHTCMFACFLSQEEPKRVHQALKDPS
nr:hypothetical protein [Tanacetum cinerariifolium]